MAGQEIRIENFKNTAFYEIAAKANINGGSTLKGVEIQLFEQATEGMDVSLEEFGLSVGKEELTAKQARKNIANQGEELEKLYKSQFGKQGRQAVESSEVRANAMVETAKMSFERNHKDIKFTPEEFAKRPMFTEAKYYENPTAYAADLVAWAKDVAASYDLHDKMSNEELAAAVANVVIKKADDVMLNDDLNTDRLSNEMQQLGNQILKEVEEGKAEIIQIVKNAEGHIVKTIRSAEGHIVKVVQDAESHIIYHVERSEANLHAHLNHNTGVVLERIDDAENAVIRNSNRNTRKINGHTTNVGRAVQANDDYNTIKVMKQNEQNAQEIIKILNNQPTKQSIALDILKSYGYNVAKGVLTVGSLMIPGVAPVLLGKMLNDIYNAIR